MNSRTFARTHLLAVAVVLLALGPAGPAAAVVEGDPIDVVIALDVSGTMRGLIDSARLKVWEIVNELAEAEPTPRLRVALITFGNQRGSRQSGWVRVETGLTDDLDRVFDRLFRLESRGADEFVGRVLHEALELDWSASEHALRLLFIAGNESADQDPEVRFRWLSEAAKDAGIFVGAIYCGPADQAAAATWREMAELAEGSFATIDHKAGVSLMDTPFDSELAELGELINETFVPLGRDGDRQKRSRARQDRNARSLGLPVAAARAQTKGSALYSSPGDLVSLFHSGEFHRLEVAERDLPKPLRRLSAAERTLFLEDMDALRQRIRERIAELAAARRHYVAERRAELGGGDDRSFDAVVRQTIREKAAEIGYSFPER